MSVNVSVRIPVKTALHYRSGCTHKRMSVRTTVAYTDFSLPYIDEAQKGGTMSAFVSGYYGVAEKSVPSKIGNFIQEWLLLQYIFFL